MRRILFGLASPAALAMAGTAAAQSSVTLFGVVDASISHYSVSRAVDGNTFRPAKSQTVLANGGNSPSRLGFRGTEDLGGGLAAGFWLEAPLGNDSGSTQSRAFDFSRRSTVSLSGGFGELRLGRDNTPTDWNDVVFSPFLAQSVGTTLILQAAGVNLTSRSFLPGDANAVRASNSIGYFLPPNLGGFYGQVMYAFHEQEQTDVVLVNGGSFSTGSTKGRYVGGRFGYAKGSLNVAASYGESTLGNFAGTLVPPYGPAQWLAAYDAKARTANLGASYDFGLARVMGEISQVKTMFEQRGIGASDSTKNKAWVLGAVLPVGAGQIKLSYSRLKIALPDAAGVAGVVQAEPSYRKFAIGYVHNLSKRTALYATAARLSNKNGAALAVGGKGNSIAAIIGNPNAHSTGYEFGVRHAF